jgi:hypothetical protein
MRDCRVLLAIMIFLALFVVAFYLVRGIDGIARRLFAAFARGWKTRLRWQPVVACAPTHALGGTN